MITANEILIKASEFLNEENWCRGSYTRDSKTEMGTTSYCALGAMRMVAYGVIVSNANQEEDAIFLKAVEAADRVIAPSHPVGEPRSGGAYLVNFNDRRAKDVYDVKDVLRRAGEAC